MEMKDAYKQAFKEELKPLVEAGKITVLTTLEELADDIAEASLNALERGAELSKPTWDDAAVIPAVAIIRKFLKPIIDKISPN